MAGGPGGTKISEGVHIFQHPWNYTVWGGPNVLKSMDRGNFFGRGWGSKFIMTAQSKITATSSNGNVVSLWLLHDSYHYTFMYMYTSI